MAARLRGTGAGGLVLYNAPDWHERVHLMRRDCIIDTRAMSDPSTTGAIYMPSGTGSSTDALPAAETSLNENDLVQGSSVIVKTWDPVTMGCVQATSAQTALLTGVHPAYNGTNPVMNPQYSGPLQKRTFRSILMQVGWVS